MTTSDEKPSGKRDSFHLPQSYLKLLLEAVSYRSLPPSVRPECADPPVPPQRVPTPSKTRSPTLKPRRPLRLAKLRRRKAKARVPPHLRRVRPLARRRTGLLHRLRRPPKTVVARAVLARSRSSAARSLKFVPHTFTRNLASTTSRACAAMRRGPLSSATKRFSPTRFSKTDPSPPCRQMGSIVPTMLMKAGGLTSEPSL